MSIACDKNSDSLWNWQIYSKIFIIGQSPGEAEDKQGKPFVGRVSWHLNAAMKEA